MDEEDEEDEKDSEDEDDSVCITPGSSVESCAGRKGTDLTSLGHTGAAGVATNVAAGVVVNSAGSTTLCSRWKGETHKYSDKDRVETSG